MIPDSIPQKRGECIFSKVLIYPSGSVKCTLLDFLFNANCYVYTFERPTVCPFSNKNFMNGLDEILNEIAKIEEEE